jgi:UDP-N-acetylglucosamine:LPS N-acetylglucosamine transferase
MDSEMKIGIICSPGGHLTIALEVLEAFEGHEVFLISYDTPNMQYFYNPGIANIYHIHLRGHRGIRAVLTMIGSCLDYIRIFLKERPKLVFSTGSEIAVPAFYIGKMLFRTKLIFLETATRVVQPSLTARLLYPITDLFLVQWPSLQKALGRKARYEGNLL